MNIIRFLFLSSFFFFCVFKAFISDVKSENTSHKAELIGVFYYKNLFGHVHQNPEAYSRILGKISCGVPVEVYTPPKEIAHSWRFVKFKNSWGYIDGELLSEKIPVCFEKNYPKFISKLALTPSEEYFFSRLYDQLVLAKPQVK